MYRWFMGGSRARRLTVAGEVAAAGLLGLWLAMHRVPWLGPLVADTGRSIVGPGAVGAAEDFAYGVDDHWQQFWRQGEAPVTYWEVPSGKATTDRTRPVLASGAQAYQHSFPPADVGPVHASLHAPGDGSWVPMVAEGLSTSSPVLVKTLLHPDERRPWSAVAIVAIDLEQVGVHLKAGQYVPQATEPEAQEIRRTGLVPAEHQDRLLAAFNGGFKTVHGKLGMRADGVTLIRPKSFACTIAGFEDGGVDIRTWTKLLPHVTEIEWYRQTPRCLVERGQRAEGLDNPHLADWGSAVSGTTIIRRSALGITADRRTLLYALGESISAANIALALTHVGATTVAQLDVNGTLPKFLVYDRVGSPPRLVPRGLIDSLTFTRNEYIREPAPRDFFYLTVPRTTRL